MARGGTRENAGRPKGSVSDKPKADGRIVISCLKEEEKLIKELAKENSKSVSRYIVDIICNKS